MVILSIVPFNLLFYLEFERFEVKKKDQENELKRLLGLKMDRKEFETSASQKAGNTEQEVCINSLIFFLTF